MFILSVIILWIICPAIERTNSIGNGHISSNQSNSPSPSTVATPVSSPTPIPLYNYYNISEKHQNLDISMNVLEIDLSNPEVMVRPVSSHKTLFGYKYLSEMSEEWQADAAVNAGFSHSNGLLGGLLCVNQEFYVPATGNYPVLFVKGQEAFIKDAKTKVWIEGEDVILDDVYFNRYSSEEGIYVFTNSYGTMNRIDKRHLNASISGEEVQGLIVRHKSFEIPKDGFLISAIGKAAEAKINKLIKPGMVLDIKYEVLEVSNKIAEYDWGYECGSWIVRDYEVVAPDSDNWVGTLQTRVPRTAVGIKEDGTLVFIVVDGRQKGFSDGLTLKELGQEMLKLGIKNAVNLDGGASSEMIIDGKIVNRPSAGRERMLACAFIIRKK